MKTPVATFFFSLLVFVNSQGIENLFKREKCDVMAASKCPQVCVAMNCLVGSLGGCDQQTKAELMKLGFDVDEARNMKRNMGCG